jgi:uncharacterized protein (TIGR00725 family)
MNLPSIEERAALVLSAILRIVKRVVAVCGPGGEVAPELLRAAEHVGTLLAAAGVDVVTGGLDGVMAAAARGARAAGGRAIGVLPGTDARAGNEYLSMALATGLGQLRNGLVVNAADAVIAVGGSWGTLSEIALAGRAAKPVVVIHGWQIRDEAGRPVPVATADDAEEAVAFVLQSLRAADD